MRKLAVSCGDIYNRLTLVREVFGGSRRRWLCECVCGNLKIVSLNDLISNHVRSCGCFRVESTKARATIHGMYETAEYDAWVNMKSRCLDSNSSSYEYYGALGVFVCQEWLNSFEVFLNDVGLKPSKEYSLDRINVYGNYEPGNVRWSLIEVQSNNKRTRRVFSKGQETLTLLEWSKKLGVPYKTLHTRLSTGWTIEQVLV